jgi:hypothetical protein
MRLSNAAGAMTLAFIPNRMPFQAIERVSPMIPILVAA